MEDYIFNFNCGALKMFDEYEQGASNIEYKYELNHPEFKTLREKYHVDDIAGSGDELSKALNLLKWVNSSLIHDGNKSVEPNNSLAILEHAYQKGIDHGVACFCLAIVLSECLLTVGLKSRVLHLMPLNPYDFDSHVVVMVFINSLDKWIMLDPTYNCYCMDESGIILSPWEVRQRLGEKGAVICNTDMLYNGKSIQFEEANEARKKYYAKNTFYMYSTEINTFNSEYFPTQYGYMENQRNTYLCPKGFDPFKHEREKALYCLRETGGAADFKEYYEFVSKTRSHRIVADFETFTKAPIFIV